MEMVLFVGIPATGKSTFYKLRFADTHVRINGDMLRGNNGCERDLIEACLKHGQPFVIDKMNFTQAHRTPYLERAKEMGFLRTGYYFQSKKAEALARNKNHDRQEKNLPDVAIYNAASKLELPSYEEGFDRLHYVRLDPPNGFGITKWAEVADG